MLLQEGIDMFASGLCFGLFLYKWVVIASIILTWVSPDPHNGIVIWINKVSRPLWRWCERYMPMRWGHYSAYASIMLILFLQAFLPASLRSIGLFAADPAEPLMLLTQMGGHALQGVGIVVQSVLFFCILILGIWFFLELVRPSYNNPIVQITHAMVDPIITPIQRYLPDTRIDFSPLVGIALFMLVSRIIVSPVAFYGAQLSYPVAICVY